MNKTQFEPTIAQQNGIMYQIRQKYGVAADTDSYKLTHIPQYPKDATSMISYFESRGGIRDAVLWYGIRLVIKEYMLQRLTQTQANNMVAWAREHLGGNLGDELQTSLNAVVTELDGRLPIRIRAAKEGSLIPIKNILFTIETSIPDVRWFSIVSYFEAKLSRVWSPTTVATTSYYVRQAIMPYLEKTCDYPEAVIDTRFHDFGARGVPAGEAAAFSGSGHAVSFLGSDTILAGMAIEMCYGDRMPLISIPATEHSTTVTHGRDGEEQLVEQMFDAYAKPGAYFATVIDSYDAIRFIREIAPKFKQRLIESGATWIFRPDSEDPIQMPIKVVQELKKVFGCSVNNKGYKVLNNVAVIQGDGIVPIQINEILDGLVELGYSAENMAFGMGGGLLQKNDRDTHKFSLKACSIEINGAWRDVYKDPATYDKDWNKLPGQSFKTSKKGRYELVQNTETKEYESIPYIELSSYEHNGWISALELVYENGYMFNETTFAEIRQRAGTII